MHPERKKNRLLGYDYSRDGYYFMTTRMKKDPFCFGQVKAGRMELNEYGRIVEEEWWVMIDKFPYTLCPAFIVMPDHVHGIVGIDRGRMKRSGVKDPPKVRSLSSLIGGFKMRASKRIHLAGYDSFRWQSSFYDHIIRNERSLHKIIRYIKENPLRAS